MMMGIPSWKCNGFSDEERRSFSGPRGVSLQLCGLSNGPDALEGTRWIIGCMRRTGVMDV
jgi:hypothetical protein